MRDYHINIFYSDDDDGHITDILDLNYCSAFGNSTEKALAEALKAKTAWLAVARENGIAIPVPSYWPAIYQVS